MSKYKIRGTWVTFNHCEHGRLAKVCTTRELARDATGQLWVAFSGTCTKVDRARPYTLDKTDDLFNQR